MKKNLKKNQQLVEKFKKFIEAPMSAEKLNQIKGGEVTTLEDSTELEAAARSKTRTKSRCCMCCC